MPFPKEAFSYSGGCNCRAIRYRVTVPEYTSRHYNPYDHPTPRTKLPMAAICHYNDCRRSNAQVFNMVLVNVLDWVDFSLLPITTPATEATITGEIASTIKSRDEADAARESPWINATQIFDNSTGPNETILRDTWMKAYHSSKEGKRRSRGFCGRCGTPLWYFVFEADGELPEWWFPQLDLRMGSVDRCDLEKEWFVPDRELWLDFGLGWAGDITEKGHGEGLERMRFGTWK